MKKGKAAQMKLLQIKKYPYNTVLRKKSVPVAAVTEEEQRLFEAMHFTLRQSSGIGLAAPQIGVLKQLIVADIGEGPVMLANPEIIRSKGSGNMVEGCLSVPGATVDIQRPYEVVVTGLNEKGRPVEVKATGLMARVLQHEIDHLRGKLIVDYMSLLDKIRFRFTKQDKKHADL